MSNDMSEDIKELFEAYEEDKRYGDTNAILITTDNENETARIATDMHRGFFYHYNAKPSCQHHKKYKP